MAWWRAWYADGRSVSSGESSWLDLPADGLVILKVWRGRGPKAMYCGLDAIWPKAMYCGLDAIWWDGDGRVYQLDIPPSLKATARSEAKRGWLKFGVQIPDRDYERIYAEALAATE